MLTNATADTVSAENPVNSATRSKPHGRRGLSTENPRAFCAAMSALCLTVLPFRLRIAKLAKRALPAYSHALLDILSADSVSFFSFAESNDETISMISTLSSLRKLPAGADFTVASERWRCLIVSEGEIVNASSSSMICMVSEVLAKAGFSIFYVSGSTTDYGTERPEHH